MVSVRIANTHANVLASEYWWALVLFLLMSSIVIADSKLKLDFPDEFYSQSINTKLKRGSQAHKIDDNEQKWRKSASSPASNDARWRATPVYERNPQLKPLIPGVRHSSQTLQTLDIQPQLELRF
tara:strand:+ start:1234 stop:1608 length:375 start_codon:yes stop_codon:yes gene_type:complete